MPSTGSPFLRSPPFPWVAPDVAAVSRPGSSRITDPMALVAAIRLARVGGPFWLAGEAGNWCRSPCAVRGVPGEDAATIAWLTGIAVVDDAGNRVAEAALERAALDRLAAATYRDPYAGREIDAFGAVSILADWRRMIDGNRPITVATGMAAWKRDAIAQFLWNGSGDLKFAAPDAALVAQGHDRLLAVPCSRWVLPDGASPRDPSLGGRGWFSSIQWPGSGVPSADVDHRRSNGGVYFDPDRESEVETILATHAFDADLLERAGRLRAAIVAARLGKYGRDLEDSRLPDLRRDRPVILAVGQVDDDLSVIRGGAGLSSNAAFLARVRAEEPDAYVIYRPHPDVAAGLRRGRIADPIANGLADRVSTGGSLLGLIARVDGVHVLSSLTGFEALMRGCPVTVHGSPFYAGWGLTRDLVPQPARRGRSLPLDALVAGALILAPRYRDPETELPCGPELLVARLAGAQPPRTTLVTGFRKALGATRRTLAAAGVRM